MSWHRATAAAYTSTAAIPARLKDSGAVSRSCHSVAEASAAAPMTDYRFISPVFDSISKQGYTAAFTPGELRRAFDDGLLDGDTFALGGVSADTMALLRDTGFSAPPFSAPPGATATVLKTSHNESTVYYNAAIHNSQKRTPRLPRRR